MSNIVTTTPWFSGDQKPLSDKKHVGPYERDYGGVTKTLFCWWDGSFYGFPALTPETSKRAFRIYGYSTKQNLPWRGVMK